MQVEVELGDPALEPAVRAVLPPGCSDCPPAAFARKFGLRQNEDGTYELTGKSASWLDHTSFEVALTRLEAEIRLHIATNARERLFVHAGVVARDGRALVIPGGSFSGKTMLVAALVEAGATYYSDEYAVLDEEGLVHPYPRPLSLRTGNGSATRERRMPDATAVAGDERGEIAAVVVTHYRVGAEWQPQRLSAGPGMVALLANAVSGQQSAAQWLEALRRAVFRATTLEGERGEAGPVASALLDELAAPAP